MYFKYSHYDKYFACLNALRNEGMSSCKVVFNHLGTNGYYIYHQT